LAYSIHSIKVKVGALFFSAKRFRMAYEQTAGPYRFSRSARRRLSAIKARRLRDDRAGTADETRSRWHVLELWSKRLTTVTAIILNLAGYTAFATIIYFLVKDFRQTTIVVAPISVPKTLADTGYTQEVATQRLQSALNKVVERTHSLTFIGRMTSGRIAFPRAAV
jgi:hypothetical protein